MENVSCSDISFIIKIIANLLKYLHYIIPMLLIVLIIYDIFKVVIGKADDKSKSEAFNIIVKRIIYAVIIFLTPTLLILLFQRIDKLTTKSDSNLTTNPTSWIDCFNEYYRR